jgi:hypothetical protein
MGLAVAREEQGYRLCGPEPEAVLMNRFFEQLQARPFSPATVRAYAYDLLNFSVPARGRPYPWRCPTERSVRLP